MALGGRWRGRRHYTDADGRYRLDALPGVRTSIRVKADGYRSVLIGGVEGAPGSRIVRDFALNPQSRDQIPGSELTGVSAVLAGHPDGVRIGQITARRSGPAEGAGRGGRGRRRRRQPIKGSDMSKVAQAIRGEGLRGGADGPPGWRASRARRAGARARDRAGSAPHARN
ncbi:MAG: carboxypeptidase-like regulatory domain-containing protein [bacterium]